MTILLSKKQVMEEYGLGRHLLDKATRERQITYIKLERKVLFKREHIEEYLARNTGLLNSQRNKSKKSKKVQKNRDGTD
jgi:hypothetical protein